MQCSLKAYIFFNNGFKFCLLRSIWHTGTKSPILRKLIVRFSSLIKTIKSTVCTYKTWSNRELSYFLSDGIHIVHLLPKEQNIHFGQKQTTKEAIRAQQSCYTIHNRYIPSVQAQFYWVITKQWEQKYVGGKSDSFGLTEIFRNVPNLKGTERGQKHLEENIKACYQE